MATYLEKMFILEGLIFAVIGTLFFIFPLQSIISLSVLIAIAFIVVGILTIVRSGNRQGKGFYIFNGIINIIFGLILWLYPVSTLDLLVLLYGIWVLIRGMYLMFISIRRGYFGLNIYTLSNAILVIFGAMVVFRPFSALITAPYFIGTALIIMALGEIYLGVKLKDTFR
ncbi:MAG: DUF308 domain-containing protein [Turicibacter sp.]|nr:DUF308 domain-containing protein [Turicibacter sp.]